RKRGNPSEIAIGISTVEGVVSSSDVTEFAHALRKSTEVSIDRRLRTSNEIGHQWPLGSYLRHPAHRLQHRNSSKAADELATLQLMGVHPLPPNQGSEHNGLVSSKVSPQCGISICPRSGNGSRVGSRRGPGFE